MVISSSGPEPLWYCYCKKCGKLLLELNGIARKKCPKCGHLNEFNTVVIELR